MVIIEGEIAFMLGRDVSPQSGQGPQVEDFCATIIIFEVVRPL